MFKSIRNHWYVAGTAVIVGKAAQKSAPEGESELSKLPCHFWERLARVAVDRAITNADLDVLDCRVWGYPDKWIFACYASSMLVTTPVADEVLTEFGYTESRATELFMVSITTFEDLLEMIETKQFRSTTAKDTYLFATSIEAMKTIKGDIVSGLKARLASLDEM